jgi:hypothetical protein
LTGIKSAILDKSESLGTIVAFAEVREEIDTSGCDWLTVERDGSPGVKHGRLISSAAARERAGDGNESQK